MLLCTSEQMRSIDRRTIETYGIPGMTLMERAGHAVARTAMAMLGKANEKRVVIVCGKGNNGGDGFVCSRLLAAQGARVRCLLLGERSTVAADARAQLEQADQAGVPIVEITDAAQIEQDVQADLVIDAILGTGLQGPARGLAVSGIALVNRIGAPVLAVDTPSGLTPDAGWPDPARRAEWRCVKARRTVAIGLMKADLAVYPGKVWAGRVEVADIDLPPEAIAEEGLWLSMPAHTNIGTRLPRRAPDAHKGDCGRVVVVAGSVGMTGAAALTANAAMRAGAGMAILGVPESLVDVMAVKLTEVMTRPLPETPARTLSLNAEDAVAGLLQWGDVLAIGPGLSRHDETTELVRRTVSRSERPVVLDADGLNAFAGQASRLQERRADAVLTPHIGELSRLLDRPIDDIQANRIAVARETAQTLGLVLVLKGASSVVAGPDGRVSINPTGNPGMATAGAGDVLTGVIAGLIAQGLPPYDAGVMGVYLHGLSGDIAAAALGQRSLMAGDLIAHLPEAMLQVERACVE